MAIASLTPAHTRTGRTPAGDGVCTASTPTPRPPPHVRWMFAQRLAGSSVAGIARALNERGIPCPSSADPERNRHRTGDGWTLRTVAAILANPRYTGRQVWNRQGINRDRDAVRHGAPPTRRWNPTEQWAVSTKASHPALVSEEDFVAAQAISALATPSDGGIRSYQLVGRIRCRECGRRLHSHWVNDRPGYRCRHGHTSAKTSTANRAPILYVREDHALAKIAALLPDDAAVRPAHVADYLRDHNLMIACAPGTYAIETDPSLAIPPADRLRPPQSLRNATRNDPTQLVSKT
jgi:site-specific DNA recombinase